MFFFGFAGVFVLTQMHGLGLKLWQKWLILAVYIGSVTLVYSQRGWAQLNEIVRIPVIEYFAVVVLALILPRRPVGGQESAPAQGRGR